MSKAIDKLKYRMFGVNTKIYRNGKLATIYRHGESASIVIDGRLVPINIPIDRKNEEWAVVFPFGVDIITPLYKEGELVSIERNGELIVACRNGIVFSNDKDGELIRRYKDGRLVAIQINDRWIPVNRLIGIPAGYS